VFTSYDVYFRARDGQLATKKFQQMLIGLAIHCWCPQAYFDGFAVTSDDGILTGIGEDTQFHGFLSGEVNLAKNVIFLPLTA